MTPRGSFGGTVAASIAGPLPTDETFEATLTTRVLGVEVNMPFQLRRAPRATTKKEP